MSERVTVDKVCGVRPVDAFSVGVINGLIGGALFTFIGKLVEAGFDSERLSQVLQEFERESGLTLDAGDARFWDQVVDGLLQYQQFGAIDAQDVQKLTPKPVVSLPKSRLQSLEHTLPPYVEGRDRKVYFQDDGSILYAKEEGDWEPPRDISGYERDPQNPWLFHPLWPECVHQYGIAIRKPACGCIDIVMRCTRVGCQHFRSILTHTNCYECVHRQS
jgi:hypothetical protein